MQQSAKVSQTGAAGAAGVCTVAAREEPNAPQTATAEMELIKI